MSTQLSFLQPAEAQFNPTFDLYPPDETPTARLAGLGPSALSTAELIALVLGSREMASPSKLLAEYDGAYQLARVLSPSEFARRPGIGPTAAARLIAAFELGRRVASERLGDRQQIRSPADAAQLLIPSMGILEQEELRVILLDTKNHVLATVTVYRGSLNTSLIRVAEVYREAIRRQANAIVVVHNHPSGDPLPSPEDIAVTRQIVAAGKLLDIELLDHLIIAGNLFISLKERGLGFN